MKINNVSDEFQQTFYVAETGLKEGEQWLLDQYLGPWGTTNHKRDLTRKGLYQQIRLPIGMVK